MEQEMKYLSSYPCLCDKSGGWMMNRNGWSITTVCLYNLLDRKKTAFSWKCLEGDSCTARLASVTLRWSQCLMLQSSIFWSALLADLLVRKQAVIPHMYWNTLWRMDMSTRSQHSLMHKQLIFSRDGCDTYALWEKGPRNNMNEDKLINK